MNLIQEMKILINIFCRNQFQYILFFRMELNVGHFDSTRFLSKCFRAGIHNIRPAGQLWPAKALNLALEAQKLEELACLCHESIL